jgi:hypothetical protein
MMQGLNTVHSRPKMMRAMFFSHDPQAAEQLRQQQQQQQQEEEEEQQQQFSWRRWRSSPLQKCNNFDVVEQAVDDARRLPALRNKILILWQQHSPLCQVCSTTRLLVQYYWY